MEDAFPVEWRPPAERHPSGARTRRNKPDVLSASWTERISSPSHSDGLNGRDAARLKTGSSTEPTASELKQAAAIFTIAELLARPDLTLSSDRGLSLPLPGPAPVRAVFANPCDRATDNSMSTIPPPQPNKLIRPLLKNSALMALSSGVGAFVLILSVPIIVSKLGTEGYGVWECMLAVSSLAMVFQAAINGTLLWRISVNCGKQNSIESRRLVRLGVGATLTLILVFVPVVWLCREPLVAWLQIPAAWIAETAWLLPQIVLLMLLGGINQALLALISGYQKAGLAALIQSFGLAVTHGTAICVLVSGGSLNALLWGMIAGFITNLLVSYTVATRLCGRPSLWPLWPARQDLYVLAPFAGFVLLSNLTMVLRDNTDKILLSSLGSPAMTGQFAIAQRFASLIMQIGWTICLPLTAAVGSLYAVQNWNAIRQLYAKASTWLVVATGMVGFLICTLREPMLVFWLGEDHPQAQGYLLLLVFSVTSALAFTGTGIALAKAVGRPGLETTYMIFTLLLILITKPILIAALGAVGCVISSAVSWFLGAIFFLILLHRRLDLPGDVLARSAGIFLLTVVTSLVSWVITYRFPLAATSRLEAAVLLAAASLPLMGVYLGLLSLVRLIPSPVRLIATLRAPEIAVQEANS